MTPSREKAWELLVEYTRNENLIRHALAVEAAMRAYARRFGENETAWGVTGLLHDFDYERHPEEHPRKGAEILRAKGFPEETIHAILAHASFTGVPRESLLDRALFAVDELCGFITAVTLVRPGARVAEVPVRSVQKKLKDKAFARAVSRDDIRTGAKELGVPLAEHVAVVLAAMTSVAGDLGLD
ncbi:MAG TPA: HDIG domain-containing protein [Acidobacteriota bacterium]|nr:HDIG domain-containing protein [Acidobacteriota bacterium]